MREVTPKCQRLYELTIYTREGEDKPWKKQHKLGPAPRQKLPDIRTTTKRVSTLVALPFIQEVGGTAVFPFGH